MIYVQEPFKTRSLHAYIFCVAVNSVTLLISLGTAWILYTSAFEVYIAYTVLIFSMTIHSSAWYIVFANNQVVSVMCVVDVLIWNFTTWLLLD